MSIVKNKRIVQAFYDAANRGDTEGFLGQLCVNQSFIVNFSVAVSNARPVNSSVRRLQNVWWAYEG